MVRQDFVNAASRLAGRLRPARSKRGQSMVELALAGPMLIFLTLGVADIGRGFYFKEAGTNSARQAVRLAATDKTVGDFVCQNGTAVAHGVAITRFVPDVGNDAVSRVVNTAALESTNNGLASGSVLKNTSSPTTMTLTFHCTGVGALAVARTNAAAALSLTTDPASLLSDAVEVNIDYSFKMITPLIGGLFSAQTIHIKADEFGRAEY